MPQPILLSTWSFGQRSNAAGWPILASGGSSLDAVEAVATFAEDDLTNRTVGIGGRPDATGHVSLDASVMVAPARRGAVANVKRFAHVASIARRVMEGTPHVLLAGADADEFAASQGFEPVNLLTEESRLEWEKWKRTRSGATTKLVRNIEEARGPSANDSHDTIGILALDANGVLAGACSTSGMAYKLPGRVGDSPIVGHALYVEPNIGAAVCTGHGELVMGICGAFLAVETMRRGGSPSDAAAEVMNRAIASYSLTEDDQIGIIVLRRDGQWNGASLRPGFSIAVRAADRDELVDSPRVQLS
jgi:N4-(beta-N-acetylglucosaminyl)-L-asparaginase